MRTMAVAGMITLLALAPWVAAGEFARAGELPQIIAFDGAELTGDHTQLVSYLVAGGDPGAPTPPPSRSSAARGAPSPPGRVG